MIDLVTRIREKNPIVHCITNSVTINDCANVILAVGASAIMARHPAEVQEICSHADAFVCNLGATTDFDAIEKAVLAANEKGIPVVLDPVGVATSAFRREFAIRLLKQYHVDCIRCNCSEMISLLEVRFTSGGLDNRHSVEDIDFSGLQEFCKKNNVMILLSGKDDFAVDAKCTVKVSGGAKELTRFTGAGCMLSVVLASALAVQCDVETVAKVCELYDACAERAVEKMKQQQAGTMTLKTLFIDEISLLGN